MLIARRQTEGNVTDGDQLQSAHFDIFTVPECYLRQCFDCSFTGTHLLMSILASHKITICKAFGERKQRNCQQLKPVILDLLLT